MTGTPSRRRGTGAVDDYANSRHPLPLRCRLLEGPHQRPEDPHARDRVPDGVHRGQHGQVQRRDGAARGHCGCVLAAPGAKARRAAAGMAAACERRQQRCVRGGTASVAGLPRHARGVCASVAAIARGMLFLAWTQSVAGLRTSCARRVRPCRGDRPWHVVPGVDTALAPDRPYPHPPPPPASNGVIHLINGVEIPAAFPGLPKLNIVQTAQAVPALSTLVRAVGCGRAGAGAAVGVPSSSAGPYKTAMQRTTTKQQHGRAGGRMKRAPLRALHRSPVPPPSPTPPGHRRHHRQRDDGALDGRPVHGLRADERRVRGAARGDARVPPRAPGRAPHGALLPRRRPPHLRRADHGEGSAGTGCGRARSWLRWRSEQRGCSGSVAAVAQRQSGSDGAAADWL